MKIISLSLLKCNLHECSKINHIVSGAHITTLECVPDGRVINSFQVIYVSTPKCQYHCSICLYLSDWNESFQVPENEIQREPILQLIIQSPSLERDKILCRETSGVTKYESTVPTLYPKRGGAFRVSVVASLIHNTDLESRLARKGECNCWYWV